MSLNTQYVIVDGTNLAVTNKTATSSNSGTNPNSIVPLNSLSCNLGSINVTNSLTFSANSKIQPTKTTVSQSTNITTSVTINSNFGVITTTTATTGAASNVFFTVNNNQVSSSSIVLAVIMNYSGVYGTNGFPLINVNQITNGSFNITVINAHTTNALNGSLQIGFLVLS